MRKLFVVAGILEHICQENNQYGIASANTNPFSR